MEKSGNLVMSGELPSCLMLNLMVVVGGNGNGDLVMVIVVVFATF